MKESHFNHTKWRNMGTNKQLWYKKKRLPRQNHHKNSTVLQFLWEHVGIRMYFFLIFIYLFVCIDYRSWAVAEGFPPQLMK